MPAPASASASARAALDGSGCAGGGSDRRGVRVVAVRFGPASVALRGAAARVLGAGESAPPAGRARRAPALPPSECDAWMRGFVVFAVERAASPVVLVVRFAVFLAAP